VGKERNGVREEPVRLLFSFSFLAFLPSRSISQRPSFSLSFSVSRNTSFFFLSHFLSSSVYRTGAPAHPYCRFQAPAYLILWEIHTSPSLRWEYEGSPRTLGRTFLPLLPPYHSSLSRADSTLPESAVRLHDRAGTTITRTCSRCKKHGAIPPFALRRERAITMLLRLSKRQ